MLHWRDKRCTYRTDEGQSGKKNKINTKKNILVLVVKRWDKALEKDEMFVWYCNLFHQKKADVSITPISFQHLRTEVIPTVQ